MSKPESPTARRRRITERIDDLEGEARMFDRWAAGRREESAALRAKLAELELPQQRGKEQLHGLPY